MPKLYYFLQKNASGQKFEFFLNFIYNGVVEDYMKNLLHLIICYFKGEKI